MPAMDQVAATGDSVVFSLPSSRPFSSGDKARAEDVEGVHQAVEPVAEQFAGALHERPEWQLAERVAASRAFARSELLRGFLLYVCEQCLSGHRQEISEQQIGTRVFNRPAGYNPAEDNIVRNYARILRKRLEEYFQTEGRAELLRIEIPRGGYVPLFHAVPTTGETAETPSYMEGPMLMEAGSAAMPSAGSWRLTFPSRALMGFLPGLLCGALLTAGGFWIAGHVHSPSRSRAAPSAAHPIWAEIFENNRNTLILSSDSGLGVLENLTHRPAVIEAYANGSYLAEIKPPARLDMGNLNDLRHQRYTSFVDLNITTQIIQLPEYIANRAQLRYARSVSTEDLRTSNAILIGSKHTDPWVALFEKGMNFQLEFTPEVDRSFIRNVNPAPGEQAIYENGPDTADNHTYGTIDYLPSLDGEGHVLILQGLNMASTQAAADVLFDSKAIRSVLEQARRPDGSLRPFELLIETRSIGANAPDARILATRFYS